MTRRLHTFFVRSRRGFSLVEVVLAMGITSFALMGMLALLPIGLSTSHQAAEATTDAQIVQYVRNQLELTSFSSLSTWGNTTLYFDNQGLPAAVSDPGRIYTVTFSVGDVGINTGSGVTHPYAANAGGSTVQVNIANRTSPSTTNFFPIIVPNAGF